MVAGLRYVGSSYLKTWSAQTCLNPRHPTVSRRMRRGSNFWRGSTATGRTGPTAISFHQPLATLSNKNSTSPPCQQTGNNSYRDLKKERQRMIVTQIDMFVCLDFLVLEKLRICFNGRMPFGTNVPHQLPSTKPQV